MELSSIERYYCNKLLSDVLLTDSLAWNEWRFEQKLVNKIVEVSKGTCNPPIDSAKSTMTIAHCEKYLSEDEFGLDWVYQYGEEVMKVLLEELKPSLKSGNPFLLYQAAKSSETAKTLPYPWFKRTLLDEISDFSTSKAFLEMALTSTLPTSDVKKKVSKI